MRLPRKALTLNEEAIVIKTAIILICFWATLVRADAKNTVFGYSGFIITPTAEILQDGQVTGNVGRLPKLYADHYAPYNRTSFMASVGFLPFLEASFGFVRPDNYQGGVGDRTVAIRFKVLNEHANWPAVSIGFHDFFAVERLDLEPMDAQHFAALYLVASKQFDMPLNSSLVLNMGYGPDWLPAKDSHLLGWFGGVQYSPIEQLDLILEYDSLHFNGGIRFLFFSHLQYSLSFWQLQYIMHQLSFNFSLK